MLQPDDFYSARHRKIFTAVETLYGSSKAVDLITVPDELKKMGAYDDIGGMRYLLDIVQSVVSYRHTADHARLIIEASTRRKLESIGKEIVSTCAGTERSTDEIIESCEKALLRLMSSNGKQSIVSLADIAPEMKEEIESLKAGRRTGLMTGYSDLDNSIGGLHAGELIILAARPKTGKSAFALNIAENLIEKSITVGFISMEMKALENAKRIVSYWADAPIPKTPNETLSDIGWAKIDEAIDKFESKPLYICDYSDVNITKLKSIATRMRLNHKIEFLIIDYSQLMSAGRNISSRNEEVRMISRALKVLAGELNIPILAISQMSRDIEKRGERAVPKLSDLRDSGALEQDADTIIFIHRVYPGESDENNEPPRHNPPTGVNAELLIKQRKGAECAVKFHFIEDRIRWEPGLW